jgi:hypothetical protein
VEGTCGIVNAIYLFTRQNPITNSFFLPYWMLYRLGAYFLASHSSFDC